MIISLAETDLLIVNDWTPVKIIKEKFFDNIDKFYFAKLPDFHAQNFPFVICSGYNHISLINVKRMQIQAFVDVSCNTSYGQEAFFFRFEKYGYTLHFASKRAEGLRFELHQWHALQLKKDFEEYLKNYGQLPVDRLDDKCRIEQELEEYKDIETKLLGTTSASRREKTDKSFQKSLGIIARQNTNEES